MTPDPIARLDALRAQAQAALAAGDPDGAGVAVQAALALAIDPAQPTTRALGQAFGAFASQLIELPDPAALEALFNRALQAFQGAPDATLGDVLTTWNNLAALYHRHGAGERRDQLNAMIGSVAERYDGLLDTTCVTIFAQMGEMFRRNGQFGAMRTMDRQVLRFMLADTQVADGTRALWLQQQVRRLTEAQLAVEIPPLFEHALAALAERADAQPLSLATCCAQLARCREAQGDWPGAARLLERLITLPGLPADELTEALSAAGRAWFKAGEYDAASRCHVRAVRRRAGLQDTDG